MASSGDSRHGQIAARYSAMHPLDLVGLTPLMQQGAGRADIAIGLLDGPVQISHPDLGEATIREVPGRLQGTCARASTAACQHGTFVAGILSARRGSPAPAICPSCTLLIRPIFSEATSPRGSLPSATPQELAAAMLESMEAGARVLNLSVALMQPHTAGQRELEEALQYAAARGVIVVAAAGNQASLGSSIITRHPWVLPVVACDLQGRPVHQTNLGRSIGRYGLRAPGERVTSLGAAAEPVVSGGTSVAAPFVSGAVALLWSQFPAATATTIRQALTQPRAVRRRTVVPPLLDAWAAYLMLKEHAHTSYREVLP